MSTKFRIAVAAIVTMASIVAFAGANQQKHEVIPPWLDAFGAPRIAVNLSFNGSEVSIGQLLPRNLTVSPPHVSLDVPSSLAGSWLTLVMVDPDARSPTHPELALILHWIVVNIATEHESHGDILRSGTDAVAYMGPSPPIGTHRYFVLAFVQNRFLQIEPITDRRNFSLRNFTMKYDLHYPFGGTYFRVRAGM
ncbi:hypothetical protein KP509_35G043800 [Ceratopteris richardii]|uniref:Uncharacterized protein n=1 Tax=Ceratopteris richardii TaxID=49495 RepID=A0A8T2QGB9_CERRI|nr:hypothetical protein KP509_35G043800 [Ceratopteris richardii]